MNNTILLVTSSGRTADSVTRQLADKLVTALQQDRPATVLQRDVAAGIPFIGEDWIAANFTAADQRTENQQSVLATSDDLVAELQQAQTLILAVPVYNFGIPATLKAWIDQVARAGLTFKYTAEGPVGLLEGKKAYVVIASGGVPIGSDWDYASGYLKHLLGFVGIHDVTVIDGNGLDLGDDAAVKARLSHAASEESEDERNTA